MLIDGRQIAEEIGHELAQEMGRLNLDLSLQIVQVGDNSASMQYVGKKMAYAEMLGIRAVLHKFPATISESELIREVKNIVEDSLVDPYSFSGIIVQLPLPKNIDTKKVLDEVPEENDIDLLSTDSALAFEAGRSKILPPVIGAIAEIFKRTHTAIKGKQAVVVGHGRLVGKPAAIWLQHEGAKVDVLDSLDWRADVPKKDAAEKLAKADLIISGTGVASIVKPSMIKQGVVLIDAGTSDDNGKAAGDADPECAVKCSIFTPVPGGVGPMTVAMLFRNLITLAKSRTVF